MADRFGQSPVPEILALRRTLVSWRAEILAYFETGLSNGRVEGFNGKAKLVRMRAYGYRSFKNYRLRLLNACA
jgi:transposase